MCCFIHLDMLSVKNQKCCAKTRPHDPSEGYWHDIIRETEKIFLDFPGFRRYFKQLRFIRVRHWKSELTLIGQIDGNNYDIIEQ